MTKIALVGSGGVGKTSIAIRLVNGTFSDERKMTVGVDVESFFVKDPETGESHRVVAFDLGGQDRFHFIHEAMITGSSVVIAVFDVTSIGSLFALNNWKEMMASVPKEGRLLVGNKIDLESKTSEEDIEILAENWDIPFQLVSAKSGENISKLEEWMLGVIRGNASSSFGEQQ